MAGNYEKELLKKAAPAAGQVGLHHINVYHDDWCDLVNNRGPCNCNPEVSHPVTHEQFRESKRREN